MQSFVGHTQLPMDEAYKQLGVMRRADGQTVTAIAAIRAGFTPALRRLSRLRKPSLDEFMSYPEVAIRCRDS